MASPWWGPAPAGARVPAGIRPNAAHDSFINKDWKFLQVSAIHPKLTIRDQLPEMRILERQHSVRQVPKGRSLPALPAVRPT